MIKNNIKMLKVIQSNLGYVIQYSVNMSSYSYVSVDSISDQDNVARLDHFISQYLGYFGLEWKYLSF